MATKKKKPVTKKSAPKKVAAKKTTVKKKAAPAKKSTAKKPAAQKSKAYGPRETAAANSALKLVDEAAALLRKGVRTGADTTEKARHEAKQKAHSLINQASSTLSDLLSGGTSALRSVINKI